MTIEQGYSSFEKWGASQTIPTLTTGDEIWVQFKMNWPTGFDFSTSTDLLKFIRFRNLNGRGYSTFLIPEPGKNVWFTGDGSSSQSVFGWGQEYIDAAIRSIGSNATDGITTNVEEKYEFYMKLGYGSGILRAWRNDVFLGELTSRYTINEVGGGINDVFWFTYWNGGENVYTNSPKAYPTQTQSCYVDDVKIATSAGVTPTNTDGSGNIHIG